MDIRVSMNLQRGVITFVGLGLQDQPDRSTVNNIFEYSCTEEGMVSGKAVFE